MGRFWWFIEDQWNSLWWEYGLYRDKKFKTDNLAIVIAGIIAFILFYHIFHG